MVHGACCPHSCGDGYKIPCQAALSCTGFTLMPLQRYSCTDCTDCTIFPSSCKVEGTQNAALIPTPAFGSVPSREALTVAHSLLQSVKKALEHVPRGCQGHAVDADHGWAAGTGAASQQLLIAGTRQRHLVHREGLACSSAAHTAAMHCRVVAHVGWQQCVSCSWCQCVCSITDGLQMPVLQHSNDFAVQER